MDKYEDIAGGWLTVRRMSNLIDQNVKTATSFGLKLSWSFVNEKIRSRIKNGDKVVFEKFYHGKHTHIHIAELHVDFEEYLDAQIKKRIYDKKLAERLEKEKEEDGKLTMWEQAQLQKKVDDSKSKNP